MLVNLELAPNHLENLDFFKHVCFLLHLCAFSQQTTCIPLTPILES